MIAALRRHGCVLALALAGAAWLAPRPAGAVTMQECSKLYKQAQDNGTLGTMTWNDFRKARCGDAASPATPAAAPAAAAKPAATKPAAAGKAVFPSAISSKYAKEPAGKARMHTCLDQYNANKAHNANGGLKWIEKGGGYYSQCNAHLKG